MRTGSRSGFDLESLLMTIRRRGELTGSCRNRHYGRGNAADSPHPACRAVGPPPARHVPGRLGGARVIPGPPEECVRYGRGRRFRTSPATLNPTPATWPASRIAPVTGSVGVAGLCVGGGCVAAERDCVRGFAAAVRFGFALAPPAFAAEVRGLGADAAAVFVPSRFALRRPGRERGRLPRTLGSSGMARKNTRASGLERSRKVQVPVDGRPPRRLIFLRAASPRSAALCFG